LRHDGAHARTVGGNAADDELLRDDRDDIVCLIIRGVGAELYRTLKAALCDDSLKLGDVVLLAVGASAPQRHWATVHADLK
jgi:hypothetical protein